MSVYDSWADYYDVSDADRQPFITFYSSLLTSQTGSVLELGCGTGTVLLALGRAVRQRANEGRIVGVDESFQMLRRAQEKGPCAHWIRADLTALPLRGPFDLIVSCFNTLQHVISYDALCRGVAASGALLSGRGRLAFDVYNPNIDYLTTHRSNRLARAFTSASGRNLEIREDTNYDGNSQVLTIAWRLIDAERPGDPPLATTQYRMRQYWPDQLERAIADAGLVVSERFGDFDRTPFHMQAKRQVLVCARRR